MANLRNQQGEIITDQGFVVDSKTGLIIPSPFSASNSGNRSKVGGLIGQRLAELGLNNIFNPSEGYYTFGYYLDRQEATMIPHFHRKGSVESELFLAALADGEIANVGISPVVWPMLNGILQAQIAKSQSITLNLTGRVTPVTKASNSLARFNDSPLGFLDSLKKIVYGYRVFNRGQPIATVPFHYSQDQYDEWGMDLVEIDSERRQYYLQVDWAKVGNVVPFLPDPLRCYPTNSINWPYWYTHSDIDGKQANILLHKSQIVPVIPGTGLHSGLGTSSLWITLGFLSDHFLVIEERAEKKLNKLTSGLIGISGIAQEADEIRAEMEIAKDEQVKESRYFGAEHIIFTSDEKDIKFSFLPLRQGDDLDNEFRENNYQDTLALAFQEPLSAIVTRGGMGLGSQMSETAADENSEIGVATVLNAVSHALECIFPRVEVGIVQPNNRAKRLNITTFSELATGISRLPEGTLSQDEIRAIIDRDIFQIPNVNDEVVSTTDGNDPVTNDGVSSSSEEIENSKLVRNLNFVVRYLEPFIPAGADQPIPQGESDAESISDNSFDQKFLSEYEGMLSGDNWPQEDEETRGEPDSDDESWYWQLAFLEFLRRRSASNVQRVDRGESLQIRDDLAAFSSDDSNDLATNLSLGAISIQEWTTGMHELVADDFTQSFLLGKGGRSNMTANDWTWLNALINERFGEIESLSADIANGLYSELQVANFSRNIVNGSVAAYEAANSTNYGLILGLIELPEYPGDGLQICRGNCRCRWNLVRNGNIVRATWLLNPAAQHCTSCLGNADRWNPLLIDLTA